MILNDTTLQRYKKHLISLNYPFIKLQNDDAIRKIFLKENRLPLISWIVTQYIPEYYDKLEKAKTKNKLDKLLMNVIYKNGFCCLDENESFINGTLDNEMQIIIFNKMFSILLLMQTESSTKENITEDEIQLKNLFMKSSVKLKKRIIPNIELAPNLILDELTDEERSNKIEGYKIKIEEYKMKMEELELKTDEMQKNLEMKTEDNSSDNLKEYSTNSLSPTEIDNLILKVKHNLYTFKPDEIKIPPTMEAPEPSSSNLEKYVEEVSAEFTNFFKYVQKKVEFNQITQDENIETKTESNETDEVDYFAPVLQSFVMLSNIIEKENRTN